MSFKVKIEVLLRSKTILECVKLQKKILVGSEQKQTELKQGMYITCKKFTSTYP